MYILWKLFFDVFYVSFFFVLLEFCIVGGIVNRLLFWLVDGYGEMIGFSYMVWGLYFVLIY